MTFFLFKWEYRHFKERNFPNSQHHTAHLPASVISSSAFTSVIMKKSVHALKAFYILFCFSSFLLIYLLIQVSLPEPHSALIFTPAPLPLPVMLTCGSLLVSQLLVLECPGSQGGSYVFYLYVTLPNTQCYKNLSPHSSLLCELIIWYLMKNLTLDLLKNLLFLESFSYQKVARPAFQFFRSETLTFLFLLAHKIRKTRYHCKKYSNYLPPCWLPPWSCLNSCKSLRTSLSTFCSWPSPFLSIYNE